MLGVHRDIIHIHTNALSAQMLEDFASALPDLFELEVNNAQMPGRGGIPMLPGHISQCYTTLQKILKFFNGHTRILDDPCHRKGIDGIGTWYGMVIIRSPLVIVICFLFLATQNPCFSKTRTAR